MCISGDVSITATVKPDHDSISRSPCARQNIYVTLVTTEESFVSTAYEQYRAKRLSDREFRALYEQKRAEIDAIDTILSHIEQRREELGLTKADVARLVGARPESVRRLLSARSSNPTLFTIMKLASVLGMEVDIKATVSAKKLGPEVRRAAKDLTSASA
jgi:DNA-binding XRE family transcriptional regulator